MEFTNSLAILPFDDLSPKQDDFSDGLAFCHDASSIKRSKTHKPHFFFSVPDKDVSIEVIAEELGAEGSVQMFDDRYRASINLVHIIWIYLVEDF